LISISIREDEKRKRRKKRARITGLPYFFTLVFERSSGINVNPLRD